MHRCNLIFSQAFEESDDDVHFAGRLSSKATQEIQALLMLPIDWSNEDQEQTVCCRTIVKPIHAYFVPKFDAPECTSTALEAERASSSRILAGALLEHLSLLKLRLESPLATA